MEKAIFRPIKIKGMQLKNRIGFAPLLVNPVGEDGGVSDKTIRWYEERAKGGAGFIMTGAVDPRISEWHQHRRGLALFDDKYIPGFAKLADVIHSHGAKLGIQIGIFGPAFVEHGMSPSPYPDEKHAKDRVSDVFEKYKPIRETSVEELEQFELDVVAAVVRAKAAGIDCVELHCAHGGATLHCCSISPYYNRRTDKYGGNWENRLRFPIETLKKMRETLGEDYPILARISADELLGEKGITLEATTKFVVPALEKAGVDCFDVSQGSILHTPQGIAIPLYYPRGCFIHHFAAVKNVTKLPVIGAGRIVNMDMAERLVEEGKADIVYLGRQITADPETPKKYFEGRPEDIRLCIGCLAGCGRPCPINYDIQDEPIPLTQAEKSKKILVIGGGVGGMETARIATLRGHKVTLIEKDSELGGMVAALALNPLMAEFRNIVDYLGAQMRKLKVDVRICKEATVADVEELRPDVVILATGSSMILPEVTKGRPGVMDYIQAVRRKRAIGQKVVIWGLVAATLAISLADEGKDVIIMGRGGEDSLDRDDPWQRRVWVFRKITDVNLPRETPEAARVSNPKVLTNITVEGIDSEGIRVIDKDGLNRVIQYDTLIIARERASNDSLFEELQGKAAEVYKIGDCRQVGDIKQAIWNANEVARKI